MSKTEQTVRIGPHRLAGELVVPANARALVVFAHGSGSSRSSPRNRAVADVLNDAGFGTLLFDLLTADEARDRANVFDVELLAERVAEAIRAVDHEGYLHDKPLALFGASTGAGAALVAAARMPERVVAVVSRGGRPDLAGAALDRVVAPTLLVVGGADTEVLALNEGSLARLRGPKALHVVPGATHLFEEPGALEAVIDEVVAWLDRVLRERAARG